MRNDTSAKWKIISIILGIVAVTGIGFAGLMAYKATAHSEESAQLAAELEKYHSITGTSTPDELAGKVVAYDIDFTSLYAKIDESLPENHKSFANVADIKTSQDGKYVVVNMLNYNAALDAKTRYNLDTNLESATYYYKGIDQTEWQASSFNSQDNLLCSEISQTELNIFKGLVFGGDNRELSCLDNNGTQITVSQYLKN